GAHHHHHRDDAAAGALPQGAHPRSRFHASLWRRSRRAAAAEPADADQLDCPSSPRTVISIQTSLRHSGAIIAKGSTVRCGPPVTVFVGRMRPAVNRWLVRDTNRFETAIRSPWQPDRGQTIGGVYAVPHFGHGAGAYPA